MNKRKVALTTALSLVGAPLTALSLGIVTSCNKMPPDDEGITVSTKDVEINHNSGVGEFDIIMDEQPVDNTIYVYVITAEGPHHMELLGNDERVYHGHPAALYDMYNGVSHVRMGFTEFIGESTKTVVSLEVRYNSRKGDWVLKHIYGINLTVTYFQNPKEEVHIFSLNDLHGAAEGYGESKDDYPTTNVKNPGLIRIMNEIGRTIDTSPGSFLVTAGDNNSGDMFSTALHGEPIYRMLNKMGARYSAVGNHAFEWGLSPMATYQFDNWARTDETMGSYFLASNILNGKIDEEKKWISEPGTTGFDEDYAYWQSQRVLWADPYKLVNMNGHLVCLIGLTTKATLQDGNKSVVDNLSFIDYNAALNYSIYTCKQETKKQVYDSIESFILLTHVESSVDQSGKASGDAIDIAQKVTEPKVDAIISGHSHKTVNVAVPNGSIGKSILVGQAETEGRKYLDITLLFDNTQPVGHKKLSVEQKVVDMKMEEKYPKDTPENWQAARNELNAIEASPRSEKVKDVLQEFNDQTVKIRTALQTPIAKRDESLLYPAVDWTTGGIGHGYYINEKGFQPEYDPTHIYDEKGYIIDQLGAWVNYAELLGFSSMYYSDIEASTSGLTYPSISLINQDTMKIQYQEPTTAEDREVKLKDMYAIQTYENATKFGYLSIWQLANVINHSLAGEGYFNYTEPQGNYYVPKIGGIPDPTPDDSLNNLSRYYYGDGASDYVSTADPKSFENHGFYKGLDKTFCLYTCGPIQSYGFRYRVKPAIEGQPEELDPETHRRWVLDWEPASPGSPYKNFPAIWIMDPVVEEGGKPYTTIATPSQWLSAEQYYNKYGEMIPIITNDFLFDGANWETPMVKVYMEENEKEDWRSYPVMSFSTITRDLLIEFAGISSFTLDFDMPISIVKQLVQYPNY